MSIPRSTYRLQLRREFGFDQAAAIVPYLARLGISHLYLSPITKARLSVPNAAVCAETNVAGTRQAITRAAGVFMRAPPLVRLP